MEEFIGFVYKIEDSVFSFASKVPRDDTPIYKRYDVVEKQEKNFLITVKIYDICNNLVHSYKYTTMPYEWLKTLPWESILTKNLPYD